MAHDDFTPGRDSAGRQDKADRWAQTPSVIFSLFLLIPFIAAGIFADQDTGRSAASLMAELTMLPVWLVVGMIIVCTIVGLGGSFALLKGWLARKDELERRIDLETGFWAGTAAMFSVIALAVVEAILPGHLSPWFIAITGSGVWLLTMGIVRGRLRKEVA